MNEPKHRLDTTGKFVSVITFSSREKLIQIIIRLFVAEDLTSLEAENLLLEVNDIIRRNSYVRDPFVPDTPV
jgi:hypothetical protein